MADVGRRGVKFESKHWAWLPFSSRRAARRVGVAVLDECQLHDAGLQAFDCRALNALGIRRAAAPAVETPFHCRRSVL